MTDTAIWDMSVREALIRAQELKGELNRRQGEVQAANRRVAEVADELQDVVWRLQYELIQSGVIDKFGDPVATPVAVSEDQDPA